MNQQPDLNKNKTGFWSINRQIHHKSIQIQLMGVPGTVSPEALVSLLAKFWMKSRGPAVLSFVSWMLVPGQSTSQSTQLREKALALIVDTPTSLVLGIPLSKWSYWQIWHTHQVIILECFRMFPQVSTIFHWLTNLSEQQLIKPPQNESSH